MNFLPRSPFMRKMTPRPTAPPLPKAPPRPVPAPPQVIDDETRTIANEVFPIDDDIDMVCTINYSADDCKVMCDMRIANADAA